MVSRDFLAALPAIAALNCSSLLQTCASQVARLLNRNYPRFRGLRSFLARFTTLNVRRSIT